MHYSEYVSPGHPDKIADYISQYLLDRYIERDPQTRYAVEVQIKDNKVTLGGEVASSCQFSDSDIAGFVAAAVNDIGYTEEYRQMWGKENTISGDDLDVTVHIGQQSADIARGLSGWGDQGIFFGLGCFNAGTANMPYDHAIAKRLCHELFYSGLGGLDIKTLVMTDDRNDIKKVIVAIPLLSEQGKEQVEAFVRSKVAGDYALTVNGTGRYVAHSSIADCGTTGRKLAVDFYGGNCIVGGGSPWTKDASKADLTLNLKARELALQESRLHKQDVVVSLACGIGSDKVEMTAKSAITGEMFRQGTLVLSPSKLRSEYHLDSPIYASMCKWGLFGEYQTDKQWESRIP